MKHVTKVGEVEIIEVPEDSLDADTAPAFREEMEKRCGAARKVVLDLQQVSFVDSSGLGAILACFRAMREKGGELKLCRMARPVRALFELVRMDRVIDIHPSRDAAVAAIAA